MLDYPEGVFGFQGRSGFPLNWRMLQPLTWDKGGILMGSGQMVMIMNMMLNQVRDITHVIHCCPSTPCPYRSRVRVLTTCTRSRHDNQVGEDEVEERLFK